MILVDLNQVLISNLMAQVRGKGDVKPNKEMIRHMVLTSLRGFNAKFGQEYGTMVLCSDASDPWRKDFFPNYKHSMFIKGLNEQQQINYVHYVHFNVHLPCSSMFTSSSRVFFRWDLKL